MAKNCNYKFYAAIKKKGFEPKYVAEVGVWHPEASNLFSFIEDGVKTLLVEPDPRSIELINAAFGDYSNVELHKVALCDFDGTIELCKRESSTFVSTLPSSPAIVNDNCKIEETERFTAKAIKFSNIDDGTIDLISIDTEGSEWFVIKHMISRPTVVSIETHGGMYVNPYMTALQEWMDNNNYVLWFKDKSDSVYVLKGKITVTPFDKIALVVSNLFICLKSVKKKASRKFKKLISN